MNPSIEAILERALVLRVAAGLAVEVNGHRRHFANVADRDAYIGRCHARGEMPRIVVQ